MEKDANFRIDIDKAIEAAQSWKVNNDPLGSSWRKELVDLSRRTFEDVRGSEVRLLPQRSESLVSDVGTIVKTLDALRDLLSSDLEMAQSSNTTVSLMCGLALLPGEIFGMIFLLACSGETGEVDLVAVTRLSCVCRHFRDIVHSDSRLWTTITMSSHTTFPSKFLMLCLSRSKDSVLDINASLDITVMESMPRFVEFLNIIAPHCHRWRSFNLTYSIGRLTATTLLTDTKCQ
ncbi:hypothetical protein SCHPADRAFT_1003344 [Schizopora paradoxa]|uniref:F-box domain-containing protein n=1 Tax=Schizopora paradoxa TaxID=27342 RepID=A0A0H2R464_9AGAM|nr:hypothetical protein SCHPADRAFT_1003344 [Schizopora paradoxa]